MRIFFKVLAGIVGLMIGIVASALALELFTGQQDSMLQAIFGLIGGSIGWLVVGSKPTKDSQK